MELGVVFPTHDIGTDPGAVREFAQGAEELGFTHLLAYDHVLGADPDRPGGWKGPYDKDTPFHEPFVLFGFLAGLTRSIEFLPNVRVVTQRQTALVAKQAAEVSILSGGRLRMTLGIGWNRVEYEALGVPFDKKGERLTEQVELLRRLWSEDSIDYKGQFHRIDKASIMPRPEQTIPIWFGGGADRALIRAAKIGDGWTALGRPSSNSKRSMDLIRATLNEVGRDPASFGVQAQSQVKGGDPDAWNQYARGWQELGATHLAVATTGMGFTKADQHLQAMRQWKDAVS